MSPSKILAVDDEADFEALITQRFRRQVRDGEFAFQFAHNGEEALATLDADPDIELMLLDINMPVKPTMSQNSTATVCRRTAPSGSSWAASISTMFGEK